MVVTTTDGNNLQPPPSTVDCRDGFTPYWYECLQLNTNPLETWAQANERCESALSFLPSIHSLAENEVIRLMVLRSGSSVWLGLKNWDVSITDTAQAQRRSSS